MLSSKTYPAFLAIFIFFCTHLNAQPVISGFTPASGLIGTVVTINGNNFSTTPSSNLVRFGYVQATVSAATTTSLTVRVPAGATFLPVSVTVNQLTGYSANAFNVTSAACASPLAFNSFEAAKVFPAGPGSWMIAAGDLDGDGKTDLAYGNYGVASTSVSIHRNNSTLGNISLEPKVDYFSGSTPDDAVIMDFDGDFKPDLIASNTSGDIEDLSVFRNTSIPGTISFATRTGISTGIRADKLAAADLNYDGKPDLIISFATHGGLYILKNISTPGNIVFESPLEIAISAPFDHNAGYASTADIDNDGRIDIVLSDLYNDGFLILRNTGTGSAISFADPVAYASVDGAHGNGIADFDGDGKRDVVIVGNSSTVVAVYLNTSTPGNISFAAPLNYSIAPSRSYNVGVDDLDGDTKPDIALSSTYGISVMKNTSTPGNPSFAPLLKYPANYPPYISLVADMDNDGKADLIAGMGQQGAVNQVIPRTISILRNRLCENVAVCPVNGSGTITANIAGTTYQWQLDNGGGFTNLINNANYSGSNTNQLQLTNTSTPFLGYKFRCLVDGSPTSTTTLKFGNTWLGTISNVWENPANWSCGSVPDINTDVSIPAGTVQLNASTTINSLVVSPGANVNVAGNAVLTILH